MYINRISAKQFKCFDLIDVELPKLTLLAGANSSGKSSLLHALLVPFQSSGFPLYLSPNGKFVNMGDFTEIDAFLASKFYRWGQIPLLAMVFIAL
jgi:predicted ATP-dependent endonuclease of OLD family